MAIACMVGKGLMLGFSFSKTIHKVLDPYLQNSFFFQEEISCLKADMSAILYKNNVHMGQFMRFGKSL